MIKKTKWKKGDLCYFIDLDFYERGYLVRKGEIFDFDEILKAYDVLTRDELRPSLLTYYPSCLFKTKEDLILSLNK